TIPAYLRSIFVQGLESPRVTQNRLTVVTISLQLVLHLQARLVGSRGKGRVPPRARCIIVSHVILAEPPAYVSCAFEVAGVYLAALRRAVCVVLWTPRRLSSSHECKRESNQRN